MAQYLDLDLVENRDKNSGANASDPNNLASLAEKLVRRLGVQDALRMCQENSWYGVFDFIKGRAKIDGQ